MRGHNICLNAELTKPIPNYHQIHVHTLFRMLHNPDLHKHPLKSTCVFHYFLNNFFLYFRVVENGQETVTVEEDGVLKSHTVNGQQMMITE